MSHTDIALINAEDAIVITAVRPGVMLRQIEREAGSRQHDQARDHADQKDNQECPDRVTLNVNPASFQRRIDDKRLILQIYSSLRT